MALGVVVHRHGRGYPAVKVIRTSSCYKATLNNKVFTELILLPKWRAATSAAASWPQVENESSERKGRYGPTRAEIYLMIRVHSKRLYFIKSSAGIFPIVPRSLYIVELCWNIVWEIDSFESFTILAKSLGPSGIWNCTDILWLVNKFEVNI